MEKNMSENRVLLGYFSDLIYFAAEASNNAKICLFKIPASKIKMNNTIHNGTRM
jgi:hypothetical protein